jgi:hypothetical protein
MEGFSDSMVIVDNICKEIEELRAVLLPCCPGVNDNLEVFRRGNAMTNVRSL